MATRPIFFATDSPPFSGDTLLEFTWHPGFAVSQKQKSINELHQAAVSQGVCENPLEISSKSELALGRNLSAFNLKTRLRNGRQVSVENMYQSSKVFQVGGPYRDLLFVSPKEAKQDPRLKESGNVVGFQWRPDSLWPLEPKSLFYDWVYLKTLEQNLELAEQLQDFDGFTDIEFNPAKSFNCQARACALWLGLKQADLLEILEDETSFKTLFLSTLEDQPHDQRDLF